MLWRMLNVNQLPIKSIGIFLIIPMCALCIKMMDRTATGCYGGMTCTVKSVFPRKLFNRKLKDIPLPHSITRK
jgi:hypothetical protein